MLPTSQSNGQVNANLRLSEVTPVATASGIAALNEAFRNGLVTADEIRDRLTNRPIREKVERETAKDALKQIEIAPARRQQEMSAAEQAASLRDLQIQAQTQDIADAPARRVGAAKLQDLQIKQAEAALANSSDPTAAITRKADGELISEFVRNNPGTPLPRTTDGKVDMAAIGQARKTQSDLSPVLGPDGKPVPGVGKDSEGRIHSIPRSAAPTEQQANAQMYTERMAFQRPILESYESGENKAKYNPTDKLQMPDVASSSILSAPARMLTSSDHNTYSDAKKNWIAAVLRKESGAAISKSEETNANAQYFPQPSDTPEQVKSKQLLRKTVEEKMGKLGEVPGVTALADPTKAPQGPPAPVAPSAENPVGAPEINSQEAYDALPPGAQYRYPGDPAGKIRTKAGQPDKAAAPAAPAATIQPAIKPNLAGYYGSGLTRAPMAVPAPAPKAPLQSVKIAPNTSLGGRARFGPATPAPKRMLGGRLRNDG